MGRLIDADALIEHLRKYKTVYGVPMTKRDEQVIHYVIGHIKNLEPTAYDVEAVVAELEKYMDDARMWDEDDFYDGKARAYECAIEIVRGKE